MHCFIAEGHGPTCWVHCQKRSQEKCCSSLFMCLFIPSFIQSLCLHYKPSHPFWCQFYFKYIPYILFKVIYGIIPPKFAHTFFPLLLLLFSFRLPMWHLQKWSSLEPQKPAPFYCSPPPAWEEDGLMVFCLLYQGIW